MTSKAPPLKMKGKVYTPPVSEAAWCMALDMPHNGGAHPADRKSRDENDQVDV